MLLKQQQIFCLLGTVSGWGLICWIFRAAALCMWNCLINYNAFDNVIKKQVTQLNSVAYWCFSPQLSSLTQRNHALATHLLHIRRIGSPPVHVFSCDWLISVRFVRAEHNKIHQLDVLICKVFAFFITYKKNVDVNWPTSFWLQDRCSIHVCIFLYWK